MVATSRKKAPDLHFHTDAVQIPLGKILIRTSNHAFQVGPAPLPLTVKAYGRAPQKAIGALLHFRGATPFAPASLWRTIPTSGGFRPPARKRRRQSWFLVKAQKIARKVGPLAEDAQPRVHSSSQATTKKKKITNEVPAATPSPFSV